MRNFFEINQMEDTVLIKTELDFDVERDQNVSKKKVQNTLKKKRYKYH